MQTRVLLDVKSVALRIGSEITDGMFGAREYGGMQQLRASGQFVADIESDCVRFQRQIHLQPKRLFAVFGDAAHIPIPVDLGWLTDGLPEILGHPAREGTFNFSGGLEIRKISQKDAIRAFVEHLGEFLFARFGEGGEPPASSSSPPNMLAFEVRTNHDGGRVRYSRAFFINFGNVFGAPTSPVTGYLNPGKYSFAVEYGLNPMLVDTGISTLPPDTYAQLMV